MSNIRRTRNDTSIFKIDFTCTTKRPFFFTFFFSQVRPTRRQVFQTYVAPRVQQPSIGGRHLTMAVARSPVTPWRWIMPVRIGGQRSRNPASRSASPFLPTPWYPVKDIVSAWELKISTGLANPATNLNLFESRKKVKCGWRRMKKVIVKITFDQIF